MTCRVRESRRWKVVGFITCDLRGVKKPRARPSAALFPATYRFQTILAAQSLDALQKRDLYSTDDQTACSSRRPLSPVVRARVAALAQRPSHSARAVCQRAQRSEQAGAR